MALRSSSFGEQFSRETKESRQQRREFEFVSPKNERKKEIEIEEVVRLVSIVAPIPSPYPPVAPMPCGPPGSLTSSFASSSVGVGLAGNSASGTAGPLHHYTPYHHAHHVADGGVGGGAAPLCGTSSTLNSSSNSICASNSPAPYSSSSSPHHYSGHPSVAVAAAAAAAAAAAYHHHHHHHFASSNTAYHPYSYNYGSNGSGGCNSAVGSATTNGHHPASSACSSSAYAHYPAPSSSPSALELTRRKMISRSSPVSSSWRSNSPSPWEMEGYSDMYSSWFCVLWNGWERWE